MRKKDNMIQRIRCYGGSLERGDLDWRDIVNPK